MLSDRGQRTRTQLSNFPLLSLQTIEFTSCRTDPSLNATNRKAAKENVKRA